MTKDPVEEIRERRRKLIREKYNGSIDELIEEAIRWEKANPKRTVAPRRRQKVAVETV